ncbi:MAG: ion transporter [Candidatus Sumerlaeaceae bacterium]
MIERIRKIVDHKSFQLLVITVILINAAIIGVETSASVMERHAGLMHAINWMIQAIFVTEILLRLVSYAPRFGRFFRDGWNVFDFIIVAFSLLPVAGAFAGVARLARVLRLARLVSVSDQLRLIVTTMLRSIPSLSHVVVLLALLIYVYAILGYYTFHNTDASHWGTLGAAVLSVFQMLTLEGWVDMQDAVIKQHPFSWLFFASFVIVAVFVVVNLFIAVVLNNLEEVKAEQLAEAGLQKGELPDESTVHLRLSRIRADLDELEQLLKR